MSLKRMWINNPGHALHGTNVLVDWPDQYTQSCEVYFLSGPVKSQYGIMKEHLSSGWNRSVVPTDEKFYGTLQNLQAALDLDDVGDVLRKAVNLLKICHMLKDDSGAITILNHEKQPTKVTL